MSRSYRKYPQIKSEKSCKYGKRQANRRVRRYKDGISNGKSYQKLYERWDICDHISVETKEDVINDYNSSLQDKANGVDNYMNSGCRYYDTLEEALVDWHKSYRAK